MDRRVNIPMRAAAHALLASARKRAGLPPMCVAEMNAKSTFQLVVLTREAERAAERRMGAGLFERQEKQ